MRKTFTSERSVLDRIKRKQRRHFEWVAYPSELAREIWLHVLAIGTSRCPSGFDRPVGSDEYGYTLHYVREGELIHTLDNKTFPVRTGEICLLDAGKLRHQRNTGRRNVHLWWILFHAQTMPRLFTEMRVAERPVFTGISARRFEALYHELWDIIAKQSLGYEAHADAVLSQILAELYDARCGGTHPVRVSDSYGHHSEAVRRALDFVARMYHQQIGLKHFGQAVHLNVHHFSRKFHEEMGMAPIQYLYHFRIEQAKRLLAATERPVAEIARLVGIPDPSYFTRLFHKQTGESPRAFREHARNQPEAACRKPR